MIIFNYRIAQNALSTFNMCGTYVGVPCHPAIISTHILYTVIITAGRTGSARWGLFPVENLPSIYVNEPTQEHHDNAPCGSHHCHDDVVYVLVISISDDFLIRLM